MSKTEKIFNLYQTVLRFLLFKITVNLRRIYLDIDSDKNRMTLTAIYKDKPTELELELFDDIVTNSNAHIPDYFIEQKYKLIKDCYVDEKHDFLVFAFHEE